MRRGAPDRLPGDPLRLVVIDDRFHELYGAQENVLLLAELGAARGHDVRVVTVAPGRLSEAATARGLDVEVVPAPSELLRFEREALLGKHLWATTRALLSYSRRLDRRLTEIGPDLIVASAVRPSALLLWSRLRRRAPIALYAQNSVPLGWFALLAIWTSWRICLIGPGAITTFPRWTRRLIAPKIRLLQSGRDLHRYAGSPRAPVDASDDSPLRVLTICSLTGRKGIHVLIDALGRVQRRGSRVALTVVGGTTGAKSEAYLSRLRAQLSAVDVDVTFEGWRDDVVPYLNAADLFVLASSDEGLPGVLIEAMAAGLPCVTTEAGSAGELVRECGAGLSVPIGDVEALAGAITQLANDPARRLAFGSAGQRNVLGRYGLPAFAARFESILAELHPAGCGSDRVIA
jgi:glycosyltransferase involved in cell wall biosynthesis